MIDRILFGLIEQTLGNVKRVPMRLGISALDVIYVRLGSPTESTALTFLLRRLQQDTMAAATS